MLGQRWNDLINLRCRERVYVQEMVGGNRFGIVGVAVESFGNHFETTHNTTQHTKIYRNKINRF